MSDMLLRRRQMMINLIMEEREYIFKNGSGLIDVNGWKKQLNDNNTYDGLSITDEHIYRPQKHGDVNDHLKIILNKQIQSNHSYICFDIESIILVNHGLFWGQFILGGSTNYSFAAEPYQGFSFGVTMKYATGNISSTQWDALSFHRQIVKVPITSYPFYPAVDFCDGDTKIYNIWLE